MKKTTAVQHHVSQVALDYGKIPPQTLELEEAVLGAIMLEKDAIIKVLDLLTAQSFYKDTHQKIFQSVLDLFVKEKAIDILTVTEDLRNKGQLEEIGGAMYITMLTAKVASAAHIEYHARIIAQKFIQRELIRISSEIQSRAFDNSIDVDDLLDFSESELFKVVEGHLKKEVSAITPILKDAIKEIQEAAKREDSLSGIPSGFTQIDRITNGWQRSDLVIIAARPSMGKTAFVLSMARNMAIDHKQSIAIFSLEMSSLQLVHRMIVSETGLPLNKLRNGKLKDYEWEQLSRKIRTFEGAQIYIDDTPAISVFELRAKCRRLKMEHDVGMIIIDYLQLMTGLPETRGNREQEVSAISRSLKTIAKELNVPIIALSQLNRSVELRSGNKRPQLSDLRESGAIEQDADLVMFIHRPEKYGIDVDEEGNSMQGLAEIIIAKHRNGALGDVKLRFHDTLAKFSELDEGLISPMSGEDAGVAAMTIGSKMNEDTGFGNSFKGNSIEQNKKFDDEVPF